MWFIAPIFLWNQREGILSALADSRHQCWLPTSEYADRQIKALHLPHKDGNLMQLAQPHVKFEAQDPSMMTNLYKPQSRHHFEQSLALSGLISSKPRNFFSHKPTKNSFQKLVHWLQKYFSLCLFSTAASLGSLQTLGGVQANHKQDSNSTNFFS